MAKKRSLNEIRQEKEYGYENPRKEGLQSLMLKLGAEVLALESRFPNDSDLGREIRKAVKSLDFKTRRNYPGPTKL